MHKQFKSDVMTPMLMVSQPVSRSRTRAHHSSSSSSLPSSCFAVAQDDIMDQNVQHLSGGELQRTAMVLCLGKPADIFLIDEPSAYVTKRDNNMIGRGTSGHAILYRLDLCRLCLLFLLTSFFFCSFFFSLFLCQRPQ